MSKKKVITVSGDNTKWYDKVIFIVKKENHYGTQNIDFVQEAEKIISDYMLQSNMAYTTQPERIFSTNNKKRSLDKFDYFLYGSILFCIIFLCIMLFV